MKRQTNNERTLLIMELDPTARPIASTEHEEVILVRKKSQLTREQTFLRIGAVCAILGAVVSVAAGIGFGNITNELGTEAVLRYISSRPAWYWPTVQLGFILGALLWVGALAALAGSLTRGAGRALGQLGTASVIMGATMHVVDSSISGFGLAHLADAWAVATGSEKSILLHNGETLLMILGGTWAGVLVLFHGLPFVLFGLAVALDRNYPAWLGWFGFVGGLGSLFIGIMVFLVLDLVPESLFIVFALVVSVWMVAMGVLMWRRAATTRDRAHGANRSPGRDQVGGDAT
jgi:hypothetical protein